MTPEIKMMMDLIKESQIHSFVHGFINAKLPYRTPKGYMRWEILSAILAMSIVNIHNKMAPIVLDEGAICALTYLHVWFEKLAPLYALDRKIIEIFDQTDVDTGLLEDFDPPVNTAILLIPEGLIKTKDGANINYVCCHLLDLDKPENTEVLNPMIGAPIHIESVKLKEYRKYFHVSTMDTKGIIWLSGVEIAPSGEVKLNPKQIGTLSMEPEEREMVARLRSIALQSFLALQYEPELLSVKEPVKNQRDKIHEPSSRNKQIYPRWIGRDIAPASSAKPHQGGSHRSPRQHWRKGHWRRVPIGEGRTGRKVVRIPPTLVNKNAD